jgi:hypothetical protein
MRFFNELTAGGTTMSYTSGLSTRVAAAALVTFSVSWFLSSPAAQAQNPPHVPHYHGPANFGEIAQAVHQLKEGGVVILFEPPDGTALGGSIEAYAYQQTPDSLTVYTKDDGKPWSPTDPPTPTAPAVGEGDITDILIYQGSDCVRINLNGQWIAVCK